MALATLFDDFPILSFDSGVPRRRRSRPLLYSILDNLEDQLDQKVGHVFRRLPSILLDVDSDYENHGPGKKRKLLAGALSPYEPKSKAVVSSKDNKFQITLDTSNFQPEEITVKVVDDKIAISAKHEAKQKDVYEFCEMYRSFDIPSNVDPNSVTSRLSTNGHLTIEAPIKALPEATGGRSIPVQIEGKEQQSVKSKTPEKSSE